MKRALIVRAIALLNKVLEPKPEPNPDRVKAFVGTLYRVGGRQILFAVFYTRFLASLPRDERGAWSRKRVSRDVRRIAKLKHLRGNSLYLLGYSFDPPEA